jgi:tRNA threonylcarbamoyladenosine biosynthesis protein TsaB
MSASGEGLVLGVDTATRASLVVVGRETVAAVSRRDVQHRHGSHVLEQIDEALREAGASLDEVSALVVGTGPGSFTGLRVGLATLKTLAYARDLPIVGVMSSDAMRRAAAAAGGSLDSIVVLPAGARDHYVARAGADPVLVAPGSLVAAIANEPVLTVDMDPGVLGEAAAELGRRALEGLPAALLALALGRLSSGSTDDVAGLVPAYVALPRGVSVAAEELGWSPDLR